MNALDTNMLVRFLVRDDEAQATKVRSLLKQAEGNGEVYLVPLVVVMETLWVLDAVYGQARERILTAIELLSLMPMLRFEQVDVVHALIAQGRRTGLDLSDLLIGLSAKAQGAEKTLTFDKDLRKSELFATP